MTRTLAPPAQPIPRLLLRVTIIATVVLALAAVQIASASGVLWPLSTFTYQVNVLAAAFYLWTLASARAGNRSGLRGAVVLDVVVAGVIWNVLLTERSMGYTRATPRPTSSCTSSCRCLPSRTG